MSHTHRTRSRSANPSSRQQLTESNITTFSHLSPILSSPVPSSSMVEQSNSNSLQPSDLSTRIEDTRVRESPSTIDKKSSSSIEYSPPSTSFTFSQLIGPDTQRRIQVSSALSTLQQQIADLNVRNDINLKIFNDKNDKNLELFEYLSIQMSDNSKLIGQLILHAQQNEINTTHAISSRNAPPIMSINTKTSPDTSHISSLNTTHANSSATQISNSSIFNNDTNNSIIPNQQSLFLTIRDTNSFLDNSIQIKTSTLSLRNYSTSKVDTPALLLNTHEATCDVYNIKQDSHTQLFLAHIRKFNNDVYQTFLMDTKLPRSQGRSKFDNPTASEFANWSWTQFKISFTSVFEDQNLHLKIKNALDSWGTSTFKSFDEACRAHLAIMKDLQYSKENMLQETPLTLQQLCQQHVQPLRATIDQAFAADITLYITTSNLYATTSQKPASFMNMSYDTLILVTSEYATHKSKEDAYFAFFKSKSAVTTPKPNQRINLIQTARPDTLCDYCAKKGHTEASCLKKNPDLIKTFTCKICSQLGHMPFNCPNKQQ